MGLMAFSRIGQNKNVTLQQTDTDSDPGISFLFGNNGSDLFHDVSGIDRYEYVSNEDMCIKNSEAVIKF